MNDVDIAIRKFFRVKRRDKLPYTGWLNSTRRDLYKFMGDMGFKLGAEIGVSRGTNAKSMFMTIPRLRLVCVDPWCAYNRIDNERAQKRYERCVRKLRRWEVEYKIMTSTEAAKEISDGSLDFVYIDGMHDFDNVVMDIINWVPKVRKGGIISGHDYYEFYQSGVIEAVRSYTYAHNIQDWYTTKAELTPSWFWVNK